MVEVRGLFCAFVVRAPSMDAWEAWERDRGRPDSPEHAKDLRAWRDALTAALAQPQPRKKGAKS